MRADHYERERQPDVTDTQAAADQQALLARVAAGDDEALHALYEQLRPRLRRYLWHQLDGDLAGVDDTLQEVFLAVWRTAGSYRGDAKVTTWVFQIAHFQALRARRSFARRNDPLPVEDWASSDVRPLSPIWRSPAHDDEVMTRLTLASALHQLSAPHREALELVFYQGFSLAEVSAILGTPVGTVKSRISYARKALLTAIRQVEGDDTSPPPASIATLPPSPPDATNTTHRQHDDQHDDQHDSQQNSQHVRKEPRP
ncbi:MAG: RNA polymerase sigma factor [Ktedonobacterales bacterium]